MSETTRIAGHDQKRHLKAGGTGQQGYASGFADTDSAWCEGHDKTDEPRQKEQASNCRQDSDIRPESRRRKCRQSGHSGKESQLIKGAAQNNLEIETPAYENQKRR